ncbi:MAG: HAMP domain-containing histidine kinase [Treponema sp.]|jgi:signal transduction histidine kinase|nr:HAMP domain-containing histidine kinase [Treponema sp.]
MKKFEFSLQKRLALTYALFISLALGLLTVIINVFTGFVFTALVKENIIGRSLEIVRAISDQYMPLGAGFNATSIEAMGMYFVHEGYIVAVEDENGEPVWDSHSCDMQECMAVLGDIAERMERRFGVNGAIQKQRYPVMYSGRTVGNVDIETYGPFFYSETESNFLTSINSLLIIATIILTFASIVISIILSRAIARPVNKSAEAARRIARAHSGDAPFGGMKAAPGEAVAPLAIRIDEHYSTKELAELSHSINELAAELEEAECRQKQLTSDIAHELRTPLTCLQGYIEAMIDGVYKPDKARLESCHEEIIRLVHLIQDLNTLTNLEWETMTLNKTEFDLAQLLRVTVEQFKAAALEKGIEIKLNLMESNENEAFTIIADYDRLKQVFINLLSNAVKYTDEGSVSVVKAGGANTDAAAFWEFAVVDTGIGIPENELSHIFERFYRTDKSRNRSTGGAGIGLTIAAAIVHAHGGTISVESPGPDGRGSVFRVVLARNAGSASADRCYGV